MVAVMPVLLNEPITTETSSTGRPVAITWRGQRYPVRVLRTWDAGVYRIAATLADVPAIGDIGHGGQRWRLRRWFT